MILLSKTQDVNANASRCARATVEGWITLLSFMLRRREESVVKVSQTAHKSQREAISKNSSSEATHFRPIARPPFPLWHTAQYCTLALLLLTQCATL